MINRSNFLAQCTSTLATTIIITSKVLKAERVAITPQVMLLPQTRTGSPT